VICAGPAPVADPSKVHGTAERYVVQLQCGGFTRTAFVDVSEAKLEQLGKQILKHDPTSTAEVVSREKRNFVATFVQQHLNAGIRIGSNVLLIWN
jgi:hypothetical protein